MTKQPFDNPTSQAERREILKNDVTFHKFAVGDEGPGGRFAQQEKRSVTGATPIPTYPKLPESPWASNPMPNVGDPLGFSVEGHPPVGSPAEIEESIRRLSGSLAPEAGRSPATVETSARSTPLRRRI